MQPITARFIRLVHHSLPKQGLLVIGELGKQVVNGD